MKIIKIILLLISFNMIANATEESVYDFLWLDADKSVYVLQNKTYKKAKTLGIELSFLQKTGEEFQTTYGLDFKVNYYFTENWGLEAFYTTYTNSTNDTYKNLKEVSGNQEPFLRKMNGAYGLMALWSPFYGKVNTFNQIFYFDWGFGLGLAQLDTQSNITSVIVPQAPNVFTNDTISAVAMKTMFKIHLSRRHTLGIELRNFMYRAEAPGETKQLTNSVDVMVGFGIKF